MRPMIGRSFGLVCLAAVAVFIDICRADAQSAKSIYDEAVTIRESAKTPAEMQEAVSSFERAAALGEDRALVVLGDLYAGQRLGTPDELKALAFYNAAADRGLEVEALRGIAALYRSPEGALNDPAHALALYEQAAALGDQQSRLAAAELSLAGGTPAIDELKAAGYFEQAIKNGADAYVTAKLAALYRSHEGALYDPDKARQLYETAAAAGDKRSLIELGQMYEAGELGAPDETTAAKYYQQSLQLYGDAGAAFRIARLYQSPEGALHDINTAIEYYEREAKVGDPRAYVELAKIYAGGQGVPIDEDRSEGDLMKVMPTLELDASRVLGDIYSSETGSKFDMAKAVAFYKRAAELGDVGAMVAVGDAFANGTGVVKDETEALRYYESAARLGVTGSQLRRIAGLYRSQEGSLYDIERAIDDFEGAAALRDGRAMLVLGQIYATGEGRSVDEARAESYYLAAIAADTSLEAEGLRGQANLYRSRTGALYDPAKAVPLFQAAAALGDTQSMIALGEMYSTGEISATSKQTPQ
jgi:TPR repeat protein